MKKRVSPILDPETTALRIELDSTQQLGDEQLGASVRALAASLDAFPGRIGLPSEVIVLKHDTNTIVLLIGWVEKNEAHIVFHCVERAFPNPISAHLGDDALGQEFTISHLPE